jgi:mono/diheme cytochrome c family protein
MPRRPPCGIVRAAAGCAAVVACAAASAEGLSSMSRGWSFDEEGGAALFANVCAACHQADGEGAAGAAAYPSLRDDKRLASAEYLESVLFDGLRAMPPVGRMMSDQQAADVINYVRARFGGIHGDAVSAADVTAARPKQPAR